MPVLTPEEVLFFKEEGYLIKRQMIPAEQVERALEVVWAAGSKPPSIVRGRPETYGTPEARESGWSARDIATELMDFLPGPVGESAVWAAAEQLLGPELIRPDATLDARPTSSGGARACGRRPRGVYNTLPTDGLEKPADFWPGGCHQEGHPFQLGVVGCVDRIVPDGGGFHVWPRSHRLLWKKVLREYSTVGDGTNGGARDIGQDEVSLDSSGGGDGEGEEYSAEEYEKTMEVIRAQQPVEFTGEGGDVLFWHHRLCHAAGQNFSPHIRMSCLYDFAQTRLMLSDEDGHLMPGSELDRAPGDDMWWAWSEEVREAGEAGPIEREPPSELAKL